MIYLRRLSIMVALLLWVVMLKGQPQQAPSNYPFYANSPAPVTQINVSVVGGLGNATYYYWVIANYPIGSVISQARQVTNAPVTISGGNSILITWTAVTGATSYDIISQTSNVINGGACTNCVVATGVTASNYNQVANAAGSYTLAPAQFATANIQLDNLNNASPQLAFTVNGLPYTLPVGSVTFASVTSGTNTAQTLHVGNGSTLDATGTGVLHATTSDDSTKVGGVTYPTGPSTSQTPVVTAANTTTYKTVPDCQDTGGNHLNFTQVTNNFSCGTSGGGGSGAMIQVESHIISGASTQAFTTCISSTYQLYQIQLTSMTVSNSNAKIGFRMSTDGGMTYDNSAIYSWADFAANASGTGVNGNNADTQMYVTPQVSNAATSSMNASVQLFNPLSTTLYKRVAGYGTSVGDPSTNAESDTLAAVYKNTAAVNAFEVLVSAGTFSGTVTCYGITQ